MPLPLIGEDNRASAGVVEPEVTYLENCVILGWDISRQTPAIVDVSKTRHWLIIGQQGSGKSVALRRISDLYYLLGYYVDVLNDKHGEWVGVTKPNKYYNKMLQWQQRLLGLRREVFHPVEEAPFGWSNVVRYSPEMCYRDGTKPFSFRITDLAEEDWRTLLSISKRDYNRQIVWKAFYRHLVRVRKENPNVAVTTAFLQECASGDVLRKYLTFDSQMDRLTEDTIARELEALFDEYIRDSTFEGTYASSFIDLLYDEMGRRMNVIVDWYEFREGLTWRSEEKRDIYIAIMLMSLFNWCKEKHAVGDRHPSVIVLDEAQKILTKNTDRETNPHTAQFLRTVYAEGRKFNQHVVVACQGDIPRIPGLLYENTDVFLISPKNANRRSINFLRESHPDVFEWSGDVANFQRLPQHVFLLIDKHANTQSIVLPYPNLSHITGSSA